MRIFKFESSTLFSQKQRSAEVLSFASLASSSVTISMSVRFFAHSGAHRPHHHTH